MQYGVCGGLELGAVAADAGYDYMEWSVAELLCPLQPEAEFEVLSASHEASALPYRVANGFVPGKLKITGPAVEMAVLEDYVRTVMDRAQRFGIDTVVFGSGGARQIPDGFDRQEADAQLLAFCRMVGPIAQAHGISVVVEPLNRSECNVLNTVAECASLVQAVAHPAVRLLVDAYHMMRDDDPVESIHAFGHLLSHVHIATVPNRYAPGAEPCDFSAFLRALAAVHYDGRISIEGKIPEPEVELESAIRLMRSTLSKD